MHKGRVMKKAAFTSCVILLIAGTVYAQSPVISRLGLHGAFSLGGDIDDSEIGFGGQIEASVNRNVFVELSASRLNGEVSVERQDIAMGDSTQVSDFSLTSIGLSGTIRGTLAENVQGYVLGGINYNLASESDTVHTPSDRASRAEAYTARNSLDNSFGYHLALGLNLAVSANVEIFAEYRFSFLTLEGKTEFIPRPVYVGFEGITDDSIYENLKEDYNFGLVKAGLNYRF